MGKSSLPCLLRKERTKEVSLSGFTLLEMMVAVSIMAIVLVSVYRMHAQTISMNYSAQFYATAPLLAQRKVAEFETKPTEELSADSGSFGDEFPGYRWSVSVSDTESEILGDVANELKRIDVSISYNDGLTYAVRIYRLTRNKE